MKSYKETFVEFIKSLQDSICNELETIDGKSTFKEEKWNREGGGGGRTRVIENGNVFEKGGVNISEVYGTLPDSMVQYLNVSHNQFFACGISLVLHPNNPLVPTVHANYRYFELYNDKDQVVDCWFAGGADLTPYYLFEEDAVHFHTVHKEVCDKFDSSYYPRYKKACDEYFLNHHRAEARGIGGLFFDYLRETEGKSMQQWFDFTTAIGNVFIEAYLPIVEKRKKLPFESDHKHWQEIRRGRYVEFNLIHDKGTLFGLKTNGRIESILMSLPPTVRWEYEYTPIPNSPEAKLLEVLVNPKNWIIS
ncbi:MAG: oxygen-dependent coproporphyrinogen oxidase [Bacteroidota bacterium]|nr:oxygen-dependent coproporphyrinogen oxidase [Bacteroidota bacterium]